MPARYRPSRQPRWISLGIIAALHVAGFFASPYLDVGFVRRAPAPALVVDLLPVEPPPPPPVALPTTKEAPKEPDQPRVVALPTIVQPPAPPSLIQTTSKPDPAPPAPVKAEPAPPEPPRAVETVSNLNTRLLSATPPSYPTESRRNREAGTVVLIVVVDEEGKVSSVSVAESSGADRLDKAAMKAVRRWRWSPFIIDGIPRQVRGLVRIPFVLNEAN